MNSQLDQRIRKLVIQVVDSTPPPPPFDGLSTPTRNARPPRRVLAIAMAAITVIALALSTAWLVSNAQSPSEPAAPPRSGVISVPLNSIPEGVTLRSLRRTPVFLLRFGRVVTAMSTGGRPLSWCLDQGHFRVPTTGTMYNVEGAVIGGPTTARLARYETRVVGTMVRVVLKKVVYAPTVAPPSQPCDRQILAGSRIDIETLATLRYATSEFHVLAGVKQINFRSLGGSHTLGISGPTHRSFELKSSGETAVGRVKLTPGRYQIYDTIPGHRAAGEEATIIVTPK